MIAERIVVGATFPGRMCPSCSSASTCRGCERNEGRGRADIHEVHVFEDYGQVCHCGRVGIERVGH